MNHSNASSIKPFLAQDHVEVNRTFQLGFDMSFR